MSRTAHRVLVGVGHRYIRRAKNIRVLGMISTATFCFLTILAVFPIAKLFDSAEATVVPSSTTLNMTIDHTSAIANLVPLSATGDFAMSSASEEAVFTVTTNNLTGYDLKIKGSNNTGQLVNSDAGTSLASITSATSEATFESTTSLNGKWGYKPSKINSAANTDFLPSPTTADTTLNQTTTANASGTSDSYNIAIGARVDSNARAGAYEATFILSAVANSVPYKIDYLDNFSGSTTTYYSESSNSATASGFTLYTGTPTKTGYTFSGWCDGTVSHVSSGNSSCAGDTYQPGDSYSFSNPSSSTTSTATLYAMWNVRTFNLVVTGDAGLASMTIKEGSTSGATINGTKSGNTVTFANLAYNQKYYLYPVFNTNYDFKKWARTDSTSGAALGSTTTMNTYYRMGNGAGAITLTTSQKIYMQDLTRAQCQSLASSSDITVIDRRDEKEYTARFVNGNCWMTKNLQFVGTELDSTTSDVASTYTTSNPYRINPQDSPIGVWKDLTSGNDYTQARYHIGVDNNSDPTVWYNYAGVTAGTITGSPNNAEAQYSICPAGWRLPTANELSGISSSTYLSQLSFVTGGTYANGTHGNVSHGYYWSSDVPSLGGTYANNNRFYLDYSAGNASTPGTGVNRGSGRYLRCVIRSNKPIMQDFTKSQCQTQASSANFTVRDQRDDNEYTVRYINGECWMTQNLRFIGTTLSSSTSNVDSTYTDASPYRINPQDSPAGVWKDLTSGNDYTQARYHIGVDNYNNPTVWYNYAGATAGTIAVTSTRDAAVYDICPKGWSLPSYTIAQGLNGYDYTTVFNPVLGGFYNGGTLTNLDTMGIWWTQTANTATNRYRLYWDDNRLWSSSNSRQFGCYVRCVRTT